MVRQLIYLSLLLHRSAPRQARRSECQHRSVLASVAESRPESHRESRWLSANIKILPNYFGDFASHHYKADL